MPMVIRGTIRNGYVVPSQPLDLRDGESVYIVSVPPSDPQRRRTALARVQQRAVGIALPDEVFSSESYYED
ncbi:MAG: hypothetical protein HOP29_18655 [Phycisphaerales bacterium]|nr:hypothetical protein [Phycisphaerales bacterium]